MRSYKFEKYWVYLIKIGLKSQRLAMITRRYTGTWKVKRNTSRKFWAGLTFSLPASINVVVTFESVDETIDRHHSNESYWVVLSCDTVCFWQFCKINSSFFLSFVLSTLGSERVNIQCTFNRHLLSSVGGAPDCRAGGRQIKSRPDHQVWS